jgi:hypothetical protein
LTQKEAIFDEICVHASYRHSKWHFLPSKKYLKMTSFGSVHGPHWAPEASFDLKKQPFLGRNWEFWVFLGSTIAIQIWTYFAKNWFKRLNFRDLHQFAHFCTPLAE